MKTPMGRNTLGIEQNAYKWYLNLEMQMNY